MDHKQMSSIITTYWKDISMNPGTFLVTHKLYLDFPGSNQGLSLVHEPQFMIHKNLSRRNLLQLASLIGQTRSTQSLIIAPCYSYELSVGDKKFMTINLSVQPFTAKSQQCIFFCIWLCQICHIDILRTPLPYLPFYLDLRASQVNPVIAACLSL